jgi:peptidylprolyl isomerase
MTQAQLGDTVQVHYTGKLPDGTPFDSSLQRDPLQFTLGQGEIIPGFERAVVGMAPGESKTETISSDQAYGPHRSEMIVEVGREQLPENLQPSVGQQLQMRKQDGTTMPVVVSDISDSHVTLDANHPLAGQDLTFDITLVAIV